MNTGRIVHGNINDITIDIVDQNNTFHKYFNYSEKIPKKDKDSKEYDLICTEIEKLVKENKAIIILGDIRTLDYVNVKFKIYLKINIFKTNLNINNGLL